jgi:hypothetical protein
MLKKTTLDEEFDLIILKFVKNIDLLTFISLSFEVYLQVNHQHK